MSDGTLDDLYFEWLYGQVASVRNSNPARGYWNLCKQMYMTPFVYFVPNDDNRAAYGIALREDFADETGVDISGEWMSLDCSMLEMLIALARQASFQDGRAPVGWFGTFLQNLKLDEFTDRRYNESIAEEVEQTLKRINDRTYDDDGDGGLFPLRHPKQNQRNVELWYQLAAYLLENDPMLSSL